MIKQHKNSQTVKEKLIFIAGLVNIKELSALACYLGESKTKVYGWVRNGKISDTGPILAKFPKINRMWLTGDEENIYVNGGQKNACIECASATANMIENVSIEGETGEDSPSMVRNYRDLALMDADTLGEIQTWINDMERFRPGFASWFRLEFQNRFPEFDDWKNRLLKKRTGTGN